MSGFYDHLGFCEWPFSVVPRPELCTYIAGRQEFGKDIGTLLQNLSRRDTSSIHILWSWFGSGKTHSLYFLANQARKLGRSHPPVILLPVYTEFPKSARGFIDLYRSLMTHLDPTSITDSFLEITTSKNGGDFYQQLILSSPDLETALRNLALGDQAQKTIALRWLRGDSLPIAEFRTINISQKLSSTEQATQVLTAIFNILQRASKIAGRQGLRILWLVDEFQRIKDTGTRSIADINTGLHSLFNACPTGFSPVLSFSGSPDEHALPTWFSQELRTRIGTTRVLILPPFQPADAMHFILDVLSHYRIPDIVVPDEFFPFTRETCRQIIAHLNSTSALQPRVLMQTFNAVLESADPLIEAKTLKDITPDFAHQCLSEYLTVEASEDG